MQRANKGLVTVLMDLHMPDTGPSQLAATLRAAAPDVRVVGMSASQPEESLRMELDAFLLKPFDSDALGQAMCSCHDTIATAHAGKRPQRSPRVLDEAIFHRFAAMLPPRALASLYTAYFYDAEQRLQILRTASISCKADEFQRASHALKGSSAMLGLTMVAQRASLMEELDPTMILLHGPESLLLLRKEVERAQSLIHMRLQTMSSFVLPDAVPTHAVLTES
jgi:CheY-like chemotaxis protein